MKVTTLPADLETFLEVLGKEGCYVLCLIDVAEEYMHKHIDIIDAVRKGIAAGYIKYNPSNKLDKDNMFVEKPTKFLSQMTGALWGIRIATPEDEILPDEFVINCYKNDKKMHFERDNFKPILNSITVIQGKLDSRRVLKVAA